MFKHMAVVHINTGIVLNRLMIRTVSPGISSTVSLLPRSTGDGCLPFRSSIRNWTSCRCMECGSCIIIRDRLVIFQISLLPSFTDTSVRFISIWRPLMVRRPPVDMVSMSKRRVCTELSGSIRNRFELFGNSADLAFFPDYLHRTASNTLPPHCSRTSGAAAPTLSAEKPTRISYRSPAEKTSELTATGCSRKPPSEAITLNDRSSSKKTQISCKLKNSSRSTSENEQRPAVPSGLAG